MIKVPGASEPSKRGVMDLSLFGLHILLEQVFGISPIQGIERLVIMWYRRRLKRTIDIREIAILLLSLFSFESTLLAEDTPDKKLPNIVILATGGTIAGIGKSSTTTVGYQSATVAVQTLIDAVHELKKISNPRGEQILQVAGRNITNDDWLKLAKRVNELEQQSDVDGIVITHGTDTLEETGYFLDLTVKGTKPVVMVGSMRPSTALSADGPINLYNAVLLAGSKEAVGKGVLVCLDDQISSARDVTKTHTFTTGTFKAPDLGFLGYIQSDRVAFYQLPSRKHTIETEFDISNVDKLPVVEIAYGYESFANGCRCARSRQC